MAKAEIDLARLFREIQHLNLKQVTDDPEKEMKLDFYKSVFSTFLENLDPSCFQALIPISFEVCPIDKAQKYALPLGLHVVEGEIQNYLSFSKGIEL